MAKGPVIDSQTANPVAAQRPPQPTRPPVAGYEFWLVLVVNIAVVTAMWLRHGGLDQFGSAGGALIGIGQLTSLYASIALLAMMLFTARVPWIERVVGMDLLNHWHRWAAIVAAAFIGAHVVASTLGYAVSESVGVIAQYDEFLAAWPDMITATVGTVLFVIVSVTSARIARKAINYDMWWLIHLTGYIAVVITFFHELSTGVDFLYDPVAAAYWTAIHAAVAVCVVVFRLIAPIVRAFRYRLQIADVRPETADTVTITLQGRQLDRMPVAAGQFFLLRFLRRGRWWKAHPYSLSAAPDGDGLRFTIKAAGDDSAAVRDLPSGTAVMAEGPYGTLSAVTAQKQRVALIGGGIGIAPIKALFEDLERDPGQITVLYRTRTRHEAPLLDELEALAKAKGQRLIVSFSREPGEAVADPFSPERLRESFPELPDSDVFVCGPPAMLAGAVAGLRNAGVPDRRLHLERFVY